MADKVPQSAPLSDGLFILGFGFVAMYVLEAGECLVAFDAGMRPSALATQFTRCGLDPAKVKHVFLTHTDSDHTGGLPGLPGAKVYLSRDEVPMITRRTPRFFGIVFNRAITRRHPQSRQGQGGDGPGDDQHGRAATAGIDPQARPHGGRPDALHHAQRVHPRLRRGHGGMEAVT
jgi:glyoxylase-like metal-dependent hydrolase (beta-lactamase superfamily II)